MGDDCLHGKDIPGCADCDYHAGRAAPKKQGGLTLSTYLVGQIEDLANKVCRLNDILGDIESAAYKPLRSGGCDADDTENLEDACEAIIELVAKAQSE